MDDAQRGREVVRLLDHLVMASITARRKVREPEHLVPALEQTKDLADQVEAAVAAIRAEYRAQRARR